MGFKKGHKGYRTKESYRKQFKKGYRGYWLGRKRKFSKKHIENIKKGLEGRIITWGNEISKAKMGHIVSEETREKIKNKINKNYEDIEVRINISCKIRGIKRKEWKEFTGNLPYQNNFNKNFKKKIKKRDKKCLICNMNFEELILLGREVCVHHIDYNKYLTTLQNCCSLCNSCHAKTNHNRKHWTKFLQSLLTEKYNYKYDMETE